MIGNKKKMTKCEKCGRKKRLINTYDPGFQEYFRLCKKCRKKMREENR